MKASVKDFAESARLGLRFRLLPPSAIIEWADRTVDESEIPAPWVIDLSLSRPESIDEALGRVPGEAHADLPTRLFLALVRRHWRSGHLKVGDVRGIAWALHTEGALPAPDGYADWGACLEAEGEELDAGWRTEDDLRESIDEKLAEYADVEQQLPVWASHRARCNGGNLGAPNAKDRS